MRRLTRQQSAAYMQTLRGQLNGLDPNTFPAMGPDAPDDYVFNPQPGTGPSGVNSAALGPNGQPLSLYSNHNTATPYSFQGTLFINQNYRRTGLLIQNLSTTDNLAFNFGSAADSLNGIQLQPGEGFLFDVITPNNSVNAAFLSGVNQPGFALEIVYGTVPV